MLRRRILASAMASVMAIGSVAVVASAEDTAAATKQVKTKADLEALVKSYDSFRAKEIIDYGSMSGEKFLDALEYADNVINDRFEYQGEGDVRILSFLKNKMTIGGVDYKLFNKIESTQSDSLHSQMMPMIRISELYLIVAEIYNEKD